MSRIVTRRNLLIAGVAGAAGVVLARSPRVLPPTYGHLLRMGDNLTYAMHRAILSRRALAKEYQPGDVTSFPAIGTTDPGERDTPLAETYRRLRAKDFLDWGLSVEGLVATPRRFSLTELRAMPARTQITRHTCEEGWSAIGEWTGVPLSLVLGAAGILPGARFVKYTSYDGWVDSIDMLDALHPQTILAYRMNGRPLPVGHGAPVRLGSRPRSATRA
ncbi:MAG: molybdopterin-dependent oxidoreductase [Gemmatimonadales bacterium]